PVLEAATAGFSDGNLLGRGGFGPVYKGVMEGGQEIAVKRLSLESRQGLREFLNEVRLLLKVQHRNLVSLLGCCAAAGQKMLVYPYFPNGSLDHILFDREKRVQLDWPKRYQIILGLARGLLYLHEESPVKIIHKDIKASNVLLDDKLNPKISDFGMARLFLEDATHVNTFRISGTYGYMAPEYAMNGYLSTKTDVFSFGMLVLEIVSGRKNIDRHLGDEKVDLLNYNSIMLKLSDMEAVRGRPVAGDRGPGPVRLGRRRGGHVRPARAAVLPGRRVGPAGHVQRAPHAVQRLLHAAQAREAGGARPGRPVEEHHRLGVQLRLRREHEQHVRHRHDQGLHAGQHC
uniref:Protein kinase domain-containing protein n=1 Tax=Aegilops tauschii subsp. strangulata TaxID=200361 RepID=A0A453DT08_AEGTS